MGPQKVIVSTSSPVAGVFLSIPSCVSALPKLYLGEDAGEQGECCPYRSAQPFTSSPKSRALGKEILCQDQKMIKRTEKTLFLNHLIQDFFIKSQDMLQVSPKVLGSPPGVMDWVGGWGL